MPGVGRHGTAEGGEKLHITERVQGTLGETGSEILEVVLNLDEHKNNA